MTTGSSRRISSKGNYKAIKSNENEWQTTQQRRRDGGVHLNNLWSIWYGIICALLQGYLAYRCLKEILGYSVLLWPDGLPYLELNCSLGLNGAVFLLLPIFFTVTILKIGNLANDGYKIGRQTSMCSREPADILGNNGNNCGLFRYGGPTAPFIHIAIAFCLLIPKVLMEAKMIQSGFLPQDYVWHTDFDFLIVHKNRSIILSFTPSMNNNMNDSSTIIHSANFSAQKFYDPGILMPTNVTHTVFKTLKEIIGHETRKYYESSNSKDASDGIWDSSISLEFINLIVALVIYSVRYPAIFWSANKCLGLLFSFVLFVNGLQIVLSFCAISILYKIHISNLWTLLPLPKLLLNSSATPYLLNAQVTFGLFMLSTLLILASSIVMYFYGHTRFTEFINHQRDKKLITLQETNITNNAWLYFTHCAAFCVIISIGICMAPLIHDFMITYKGSGDPILFYTIIYDIVHLIFWIFIWIYLSFKRKWIFKIRISIGEAVIRESRSLRLIHSVHLNNNQHHSDERNNAQQQQQPLLIIGNGRTYTVNETLPKKAIMDILQRSAMVKKSKSNGSMTTSDDLSEEIYWLRPTIDGNLQSYNRSKFLRWFRKKSKEIHVVDKGNKATKRTTASSINIDEEDDGDYATLRELPLNASSSTKKNDLSSSVNNTESKQLLACVHDEEITYASASQDFIPPPKNTDNLLLYQRNSIMEPIVVHTDFNNISQPSTSGLQRSDSGILAQVDDLIPLRSNSLSTESSSASPAPETHGENHSESSSGVHSNESNETSIKMTPNKLPSSSQDNNNAPSETQIEPSPESTVVIRRKSLRPNPNEGVSEAILKEDPYGRATNMRMTSFMDAKLPDGHHQSSSATLPHYPTQPCIQNAYPNCSTMPLPLHTSANIPHQAMTNGNSCHIYTNRLHTTIPTHLNGVKMILPNNNTTVFSSNKADGIISKLEPIYTKINRATNELCHYSTNRHS